MSRIDLNQPMREAEQQIADWINNADIATTGDVSELSQKIENETAERKSADESLSADLVKETERANAADAALESKISAETTRATTKEDEISQSVSRETSERENADVLLSQKIENETTRATTKEDELAQDIGAETTRATTREDEINTKVEPLESKINELAAKIPVSTDNRGIELSGIKSDSYAVDSIHGHCGKTYYSAPIKSQTICGCISPAFSTPTKYTSDVGLNTITGSHHTVGPGGKFDLWACNIYPNSIYGSNNCINYDNYNYYKSDIKRESITGHGFKIEKYRDNEPKDEYGSDLKSGTIFSDIAAGTIAKVDLTTDIQTLLSFVETLPVVEFGVSPDNYTLAAGESQTVNITFDTAKTTTPSVFVDTQANVDTPIYSSVKYATTEGFAVVLHNPNDSEISNITFDYLLVYAR